MKDNLIKIKEVMVPTVKCFRDIIENFEYVGEDGKDYRLASDKSGKNIIGTDKEGKQIVVSIEDANNPIPFTYRNEYNDCITLQSRGINIEKLDKIYSEDNFKLVEIFKVGKDTETGLEVFNIVWQRKDYVLIGIQTNGMIGFDVRSEEFSAKELQKFIEISNYLRNNYKE